MKSHFSKARALILIATLLLLVLAFPSTLHASQVQPSRTNSTSVFERTAFSRRYYANKPVMHYRERRNKQSLLLDQDIRVWAATALIGDPVLSRSAQNSRVPLTVVVITVPVIVEA